MHTHSLPALLVLLLACDAPEDTAAQGDTASVDTGEVEEEIRVGFEILQMKSADEILVWLNQEEMTEADFEAIDLDEGWIKNQPREADPDSNSFARSPDADEDGEFTSADHYGHPWLHNATVVSTSTPIDDVVSAAMVAKYHSVGWEAGRTLSVLTSPDGDLYVRVSRDTGRTQEEPTVPTGWSLSEHVTDSALWFALPNPTANIRLDNEDSFQGPVSAADIGL